MIFRRFLLSVEGPGFRPRAFVKSVKIPLKILDLNEEGEYYEFRGELRRYDYGEVTFEISNVEKDEIRMAWFRDSFSVIINQLKKFGGEEIVVDFQIFTDENEVEHTILDPSFWRFFVSPNVFFSTEIFRLTTSQVIEMIEEANELR